MAEARRKRGRERVYDAERTRETILDAAEAVFAERGFEGASMDAIAQAAGYNKSLLFQYFGAKQELYTQVLKRVDRQMGELLGRVFAPLQADEMLMADVERFKAFLKQVCGAFFDYMLEHPQAMRLFNWEQAEGWQTFTRIAAQFEPEDLTRLEALFHRARQAGLLRVNLDPGVLVVVIEQLCWSSPAALPLYQLLLSGRDTAEPFALTVHVREQIVAFLVAGMMGDAGGEKAP